jgi:two-component system, cell cycle sensor histidine kinase and response regulator CckA
LISENIELTILPGQNPAIVKADPGQIEQLLVNLIVNARDAMDAMPNGGQLTIEISNILLSQVEAHQRAGVTAGPYVKLTVSDTGTGMTDEVKAHLFEPFFTTKEAGKGTGLGLATCFGIVNQSGGHLLVHSQVGVGTTFEIYLPNLEPDSEMAAELDITDHLPGGTETILLVEDDRIVRALAARILKNQGYRLLEAGNGEEALRLIAEQAGEQIDLLLTDVVMPWMSGPELADQMQKLKPQIKVLYTSGYVDDTIAQLGLLEVENTLIPKPFSPETLLHKVRHILDS